LVRFFKHETEKTEPNRTKKPKKTESNRFRFGFGFFLKKNSVWLFFDKNRTEPKMNTPMRERERERERERGKKNYLFVSYLVVKSKIEMF